MEKWQRRAAMSKDEYLAKAALAANRYLTRRPDLKEATIAALSEAWDFGYLVGLKDGLLEELADDEEDQPK